MLYSTGSPAGEENDEGSKDPYDMALLIVCCGATVLMASF